MKFNRLKKISPEQTLLLSFILVILIGTFLLSLPVSQVNKISFIDILFTSTSATCVTGLVTVPISAFTFFGQCIILFLIQIGGLGLITLSFFFISLFLNMGIAAKSIAGQILEIESWGQVKKFLVLIISTTFVIELLGTTFLYFTFKEKLCFGDAIFYALFHSVSAFCNAGLSLYDNNMANFIDSPFTLISISILVFAGGIGFIVWYEIINFIKFYIKKLGKSHKKFRLSLHSRIVLNSSLILIVAGTILIWFLERGNTLKMSWPLEIINSFFMSTTMRTAGFNSFVVKETYLATLLVFMILMFIGASPNSSGGGIKVTNFALFFATISSITRGKTSVEIMGRTIPTNQIYKSIVIITLSATWIIVATFLLLLTESGFNFIQLLFESTSAFATAGFSTGITPYLSYLGKIILMLSMLIGRISSLTLVLALRKKRNKNIFHYPEEKVLLG